ncbi:MAG: M48 family metalloprotease [Oligoflexia bacterium]|nr:M48 family metalloprotease [Oligoflexia bacterium]
MTPQNFFSGRASKPNLNPLLALHALGAALALCVGCASSPEENRELEHERFAQEIKEEKEVGRQMAAKLAGTLGSHDSDDKLLRYLNLVGNTVAAKANRPELAYRFGILKSEEINAFATPGGYIFVTMGLLREVRSEDELAGVLGHEIAHVTERHMYKEIMPKREVSAGETLSRMLSRGGADLGFSIGKIVNQGIETLLEKGLGQEKEHEADQGGSLLCAAAGYDPLALQTFLTRLQSRATTVKVSKTHPPFPARLQALQGFLKQNGMAGLSRDTEGGRALETRFKSSVSLPSARKR